MFSRKRSLFVEVLERKRGITDTLPDFCGGDTINSLRQSFFPGCEAEYLDCNQKALGDLSLTEKLKSWWNLSDKSSDEIGAPKEDFDKFLRLLSNALIDGPMDNMVSYYKKAFG